MSIPEIINSHTPTINGRKNFSALARQLRCSRQLLHRWRTGIGEPDPYLIDAWYRSDNPTQKIFAWEVMTLRGKDLPRPDNGNQPEPQTQES